MRSQDGVDVIDITGQLDAFTTAETKAEFKTLIDDRHYKLVLNFEKVDYVNSTGIGAVLLAAQQVRKKKGDLKIFGMKADIRKVFDLVGASKILDISETEQEALNSF